MNADLRRQSNVIRTPCAPTRKARMSVAVLKDMRVMDRDVQVSVYCCEIDKSNIMAGFSSQVIAAGAYPGFCSMKLVIC